MPLCAFRLVSESLHGSYQPAVVSWAVAPTPQLFLWRFCIAFQNRFRERRWGGSLFSACRVGLASLQACGWADRNAVMARLNQSYFNSVADSMSLRDSWGGSCRVDFVQIVRDGDTNIKHNNTLFLFMNPYAQIARYRHGNPYAQVAQSICASRALP